MSSQLPSRSATRTATLAILGAAVVAALLLYVANASAYFFLADDFALVGESGAQSVRQISGSALIGVFRPLAFLVTKVQFAVWGWTAPWAYLAGSLVLHAGNAALLYWLIRLSRQSRDVALVAAVVFLLSPWASESYFWVYGRFDLLSATGLLASLCFGLLALRARTSWQAGAASCCGCLVFAAGLLSKGNAIIAPVLFIAWVLLAARGESLAAFDGRCIPAPPQRAGARRGPRAGCVAPPSNTPGILRRRALPAGRLARLGATPDFNHGLLCRPRDLLRPRSIGYLAGLAVVAGVYLILREQVLSHLNGAYGDLGTLFARSTVWLNLGNNLLGLVVLPLPDGLSPTEPSPALAIRALFLIGAVVALAYAIRTQWRLVALGATCIVAGVLPGLSSGVIPGGSASGRFLYVPGMGLALMLAAGVGALRAEADEQPSWRAIGSMAGCLAVLAGGCVASVWHQAAIWRAASSLSRESIEQVHSRMVPGQKIFIPNLPFLYTDGPYVLKDSAFSYYCQGGCPGASVRARPIVLKYLDGETRYIGWAGSPPPPAAADEEEVFLQLPIRGGPVAQPSPEGAVETPAREAVVSQPFTVSGWAVDRSAVNGTGVDVIHIYAYPAGSQVAKLLGFATYGQPRPDIGRRGRRFTNAGFSFQVSGLAPGHYLIAAFPHDLVVGVFSEAMVVPVEVR